MMTQCTCVTCSTTRWRPSASPPARIELPSIRTKRSVTLSLHLVTVLGEAANRVSAPGRARHPGIPWRQIVNMRHRLIHGYDMVDLDVLWKTVEADLPALIDALRSTLDRDNPS